MPGWLNPANWPMVGDVIDGVAGAVGDSALGIIEGIMAWLVESIFGALADLAIGLVQFFWDAAEPDVGAEWFDAGAETPYGLMVALAAPLLVLFLLAGVIQGAVKGDPSGMLRMAFARLPGAVLAMTVTVAIADLLIRATDELSAAVIAPFRDDVNEVIQGLGVVTVVGAIAGWGLILLVLFGGLGLLAAAAVVVVLFVRSGLIYLVVGLSPFIYAAAVWESWRGAVRRMVELGFALIVMKLPMALAMGITASALVAAMNPDWVASGTEIPTPEDLADGESMAASLGLVISALVMFGITAFMPFLVLRLLPIMEAALIGQGISSGPLRASQYGYYIQGLSRARNPATAALGGPGSGGSGGGRGPDDAGGGGAPASPTGPFGSGGAGGGAPPSPGASGSGASGGPAAAGLAVAAAALAVGKKAAHAAGTTSSDVLDASTNAARGADTGVDGGGGPASSQGTEPSRPMRQTAPGNGHAPGAARHGTADRRDAPIAVGGGTATRQAAPAVPPGGGADAAMARRHLVPSTSQDSAAVERDVEAAEHAVEASLGELGTAPSNTLRPGSSPAERYTQR